MQELLLNQAISIAKVQHDDPEIEVFVIDDFLADPVSLLDYAKNKAYFGKVGDDRTAYPGIRDRLPRPYERAMEKVIELVYSVADPSLHRCMMSLTTLHPSQLTAAQRIPHVDAFDDRQYAAVHYLCGPPHGGTAFYRFKPENTVRLRSENRHVIEAMLRGVRDYPHEYAGYIIGNTSLFKQEVLIEAKFNRLILYPSNLLHCAQLSVPDSLVNDIGRGRLSIASFFRLDSRSHINEIPMAIADAGKVV
ncbi:MAG: hypothetical protein PsegKO_33590 [Pseudohongiellaceae bacterium]